MEQIINWLLENGWKEDGATHAESVRVPTRSNPLYGKSGGEVAHFGGRRRFSKGDWFMTVGKRTVYFYRVANHSVCDGIRLPPDLAKIQAATEVIRSL